MNAVCVDQSVALQRAAPLRPEDYITPSDGSLLLIINDAVSLPLMAPTFTSRPFDTVWSSALKMRRRGVGGDMT